MIASGAEYAWQMSYVGSRRVKYYRENLILLPIHPAKLDGQSKVHRLQDDFISAFTITLEGDANGAPHPEPSAYSRRFTGRYEHRLVMGGAHFRLYPRSGRPDPYMSRPRTGGALCLAHSASDHLATVPAYVCRRRPPLCHRGLCIYMASTRFAGAPIPSSRSNRFAMLLFRAGTTLAECPDDPLKTSGSNINRARFCPNWSSSISSWASALGSARIASARSIEKSHH
jgi:hypothetical protein